MKKIIITFLSLMLTASAFWPAGGVKVVQTPSYIENPQMIYLNDGSVIISWEARPTGKRQIYCQKLDTTGVVHWDAEGLRVCLSDSHQVDHHMVTDGQDVWFVWRDTRKEEVPTDKDIYAQKIDGLNGSRIWDDEGMLVCDKLGGLWQAKCTPVEGGLGIVFRDDAEEPGDISAQYLLPDGTFAWGESGVILSVGSSAGWYPEIEPSGSCFNCVWPGVMEGDSIPACVGQRIDPEGNFSWNPLGVLIEHRGSFYGTCEDASGGAIVLFSTPGSPFTIAVQRIDSLGQILWDPGGVKIVSYSFDSKNSHKSIQQEVYRDLISDDSGGCFVWFTKDKNLIVQHVDSSGNLLWGSDGAICKTFPYCEESRDPVRLCKDGEGGLMVAYDNMFWNCEYPPYQDTGRFGLYVQRIDSEGAPMFDSSGVAVFKGEDVWYGPSKWFRYAVGVPGGVMVTWLDNRNSPDNSLYVQIVDTTGKVGSDITERPPTTQYSTFEVLTSLGNQIVLRFADANGSHSNYVAVFDATGRLVDEIRVPAQGGTVTWPETPIEFSPGVYFFTEAEGSQTQKAILIK